MWRNRLFSFVNISFVLYALDLHHKRGKRQEELEQILIGSDDTATKHKLSDERCGEIECRLIELMENERLFLDSHLTLKQLSQKLGVNRNYTSEVVVRSKYGSFYTLINSYRLQYAQDMLRQNPTLRIEHVAYDSGFSSLSLFSQVFKRYRGVPPSTFIKTHLTDKYTQTKQDYI